MKITLVAMLALLLLPAIAVGQDTRERETRSPQERPATAQQGTAQQGSQDSALVSFLAAKLMLANQQEIELAKFAAERTQTPDVQEFARTLAEDHEQLNKQLAPFAGANAPKLQTGATTDASGRTDRNRNDRATDRSSDRTSDRSSNRQTDRTRNTTDEVAEAVQDRQERQPSRERTPSNRQSGSQQDASLSQQQLLQICQQATSNHLEMSRQMLDSYDGQDFDMGFLGQQIGAHAWMLAELNAINSIGNSEFQQVINTAKQQTEHHLETAKQLALRLEDQEERASTARKPSLNDDQDVDIDDDIDN